MSPAIEMALSSEGLRIPGAIVYFVAVVLSIRQRRELGAAALFAATGFGALAISSLIEVGAYYWQLTAFARESSEFAAITRAVYYCGQSAHIVGLVGAILAVVAFFSSRPTRLSSPNNALEHTRGG